MQKKKLNKLKLFAATSMAIFTLFATFAGAYAWFASKMNSTGSSDNFEVHDISGKFNKLYIHEYDETNSSKTTYKFFKTPIGTISKGTGPNRVGPYEGTRPAKFDLYSLVDRSHPLLFVYEFVSEVTVSSDENIVITTETQSTFIADGETDNQGKIIEKIQASGNPLSSIVKYKSFSYAANADTTITDSTAISSFNTTSQEFEYAASSLTSMTPFVNLTTVNDELVYTSFNKTATLFSGNTNDKIKYVAIIFDYYEEALQYIYNFYLGNTVLENETIGFKCDWVTMI